MKIGLWPIAVVSALALGLAARPVDETTVVVSGATRGYLAPCGCTKPMSGGLRRRMATVRQLSQGGKSLVLDTGEFVTGIGPQDVLKAQTVAAAMRTAPLDLVAYTPSEARLGSDTLGQIQELVGGKLHSSTCLESAYSLPQPISKGTVLAISVETGSGEARSWREVLREVDEQAGEERRGVVVLFGGDRELAMDAAASIQAPAVLVYRSKEDALTEPIRVGKNWLVTPGDLGKTVLGFAFRDGEWQKYRVHRLGPDVNDDPQTARLYRQYLQRVGDAGLFEKLARTAEQGFVGSDKCASCHKEIYKHWQKTAHASAMPTLKRDGHDRDPDCVSCHAVGTHAADGYFSEKRTPALANVGCESCHGPGKAHVADWRQKTIYQSAETCTQCHSRQTSSNFDFLTYWNKVKHPLGKTGGKPKR